MSDRSDAPASDRPQWLIDLFAKLDTFANRLDRIERSTAAGVEREFYTVDQAADRLPYKPWTIRQACNTRRIRASKPDGRGWRIPADEVRRVEREGLGPG